MKTIAKTLGVSRSHLVEATHKTPSVRPTKYCKTFDTFLLPKIRDICTRKPSYGYRRVCALLNRELLAEGFSRVNHKRIYRIMSTANLLLTKNSLRPTRTHEGTIVTIRSNIRWCSDTMTIKCFNKEKVEVAFALDTCDREVIGYVAKSGAMTGADIRDLMVQSLESRFGQAKKLPQNIQWLSDNGPPYVAHETRNFGLRLGFIVCNTPSYSPESNGMAEAFVKTFKRDYVYLNDLDNADAVIKQLPEWFNDYNENAPHKGLKMMSPREFLRSSII
jgi:putative transposase